MRTINQALATISGRDEPEPPELSNTQKVKRALGSAGITALAGLLGGTGGIQAVGKYADSEKSKAEKRRLDKIAKAKSVLEGELFKTDYSRKKSDLARSQYDEEMMVPRERERQLDREEIRADRKANRENNLLKTKAYLEKMSKSAGGGSGGSKSKDPVFTPPPVGSEDTEKKTREFATRIVPVIQQAAQEMGVDIRNMPPGQRQSIIRSTINDKYSGLSGPEKNLIFNEVNLQFSTPLEQQNYYDRLANPGEPVSGTKQFFDEMVGGGAQALGETALDVSRVPGGPMAGLATRGAEMLSGLPGAMMDAGRRVQDSLSQIPLARDMGVEPPFEDQAGGYAPGRGIIDTGMDAIRGIAGAGQRVGRGIVDRLARYRSQPTAAGGNVR